MFVVFGDSFVHPSQTMSLWHSGHAVSAGLHYVENTDESNKIINK